MSINNCYLIESFSLIVFSIARSLKKKKKIKTGNSANSDIYAQDIEMNAR